MQVPSNRKNTAKPIDTELQQLCSSLKLANRLPVKRDPKNAANRLEALTGKLGPKRLVDCLYGTAGSGAGLFGLFLCLSATQHAGELVVIDTQGTFFSPAVIAWGIDARKLLVVRPKSNREGIAATELALRSPAVSAVWASLDRIDPKSSRRLLLATETAEALGVLIRLANYQKEPSWADVQLRCDPVPTIDKQKDQRLVRVTQTRNRHGPLNGEAMISMDWRTGKIQAGIDHHELQQFTTHPVSLAPRLASAALPPKAS